MVWTPEQTGAFLDHAAGDRLYALFHLIAFRGLRRGEACGQLWSDTHLDARLLTVARQLVVDGWEVYEDDPKTDSGARTIALDSATVDVLRAHRAQQQEDREEWGNAWVETGGVFTREDGRHIHPDRFSQLFEKLIASSGLRRIRLHDLRHTHATLALAAGVHPKVVSERLGHSTVAFTLDVYSHAVPALQEEAADRIAALVFGQ